MNSTMFSTFPVLHTERLDLRQVLLDDAPMIFAFNADVAALHHIARDPFTDLGQAATRAAAFRAEFLERKAVWWTFVRRADGVAVGYGGLFCVNAEASSAEVGYGLLQDFWGCGLASEAVAAMVSFGVGAMRLHRIHARVNPGNTASEKILDKLGFQKEGVLRDTEYARGRYFDMAVYGLIVP